MITKATQLKLKTSGNSDIVNITPKLKGLVKEFKISEGMLNVIVPGSTGSITTMEYEPGLIEDLKKFVDEFIPKQKQYRHNVLNHDDNGHSHLRSAVFGTSFTVPIENGRLVLGTWQQVVFIDFDTRSRQRVLHVTVLGDTGDN